MDAVENDSPFLRYVLDVSKWAQEAGLAGQIVYACCLALTIILNIPCGPLELLPGFLFGPTNGFLVALSGKILGNAVSVWLAKTCLRSWAKK